MITVNSSNLDSTLGDLEILLMDCQGFSDIRTRRGFGWAAHTRANAAKQYFTSLDDTDRAKLGASEERLDRIMKYVRQVQPKLDFKFQSEEGKFDALPKSYSAKFTVNGNTHIVPMMKQRLFF